MTSALTRHLRDFGAREGIRPARTAQAEAAPSRAAVPETVDLEALRGEAFEEGRAAAAEHLRAEHEQALSDLAARHAEEVSALERRYQKETAASIDRRFEAMRAEIGGEIGRQVAEVLAPLVERHIRERMVQRFSEAVAEALADRGVTRATIHGPAYLFGFLASLPALAPVELRHVETPDVDLSTEIDGSILTTRLAALAESLGEDAA